MPWSDDAPPYAAPLTSDVAAAPAEAELAAKPGILENSTLNLLGLVAASGFGVLSGLVAAKMLGPAGVGVLAVVFGIIEFGRGLTNFTHGPSILEVHRGRDPGRVWGTSLVLKFGGALAFVAIVLVLAPVLSRVFDVPLWGIVLTSTLLVVGSFQEVGTARFEAENRMRVRNLIVGMGPFVAFVAAVAFVLLDAYNVYTAILTSVLGTAAMSVAFLGVWGRFRTLRYDRAIASYLVRYGSRLVATTFLTQALIWTDTLMLSGLKGNAEAGVYNVVFQLTFLMVTASTAIGVALLPAMSELHGRGADTSRAYQRGTLLALALAVAVTLAYLVMGRFILGIYGAGFVRGYDALLVLVVFGTAAAVSVPAASMLTVHNRAGALTLLSLAMALVNVPVNFLLITRHGLMGAAVATTSVFVVGMVATWVLVHRVTGAWPLSVEAFRDGLGVPRRVLAWLRRR